MMVRRAYMTDGDWFDVFAGDIPKCFERGYVEGIAGNGDHCVLNVAHIVNFGRLREISE